MFIDESHVTLPQVRAMYNGDRARKTTLVDYGFRLPCAFDNRPLTFDEFYPTAQPGDLRLRHPGAVRAQPLGADRGAGHPPHGPAGPGGPGAAGGRADRRPHRGDPRPGTAPGAGAGDHPHQEDGRGPHQLPPGGGHPGAVHAPRRGHHRAHGDHPGPPPGDLRRAGGHQPPPGGAGPARSLPGGHSGRRQGGVPPLARPPSSRPSAGPPGTRRAW